MKHDKLRWNARYVENNEAYPAPDIFLTNNSYLLSGGRALDLACGLGANSIYLAQNGFWVDSIDISESAIRRLQVRSRSIGLNLGLVVGDTDYFPLPENFYDLIVVFYFFSGPLIPIIAKAIKPGGLVVYCTFNYLHKSSKPDFNERYLVPRGGLAPLFPNMEIIVDEPETGSDSNLSRLIARRPLPAYNC